MTLMRPPQEIPKDVVHLLGERGLRQDYDVHPTYQRNDYLAWTAHAKRLATRMKHTDQILNELEADGAYMKIWHAPSERRLRPLHPIWHYGPRRARQ